MKKMKRRRWLKSFGVILGGIGLMGMDDGGDCGWDVYFLKVPRSFGRERGDVMVRELNEKFKEERKMFVAIAVDDDIEVKVVVAKELKGKDVKGLIEELRNDFIMNKNS